MSKIPLVRLAFKVIKGADPRSGPIAAVQDVFGKAYRCFPIHPKIGVPYKNRMLGTDRELETEMASIPLRPVHGNTVRALIRRSSVPQRESVKGYWYEVAGE